MRIATCRCGAACITKYCTQKCQWDEQYELFVRAWLVGEITGSTSSGAVPKPIRRWLKETHGEKCSICGWCAVHPTTGNIPVEIDHIDGDHMNNRPENVRFLCPNCHSLTPTFRNLNNGRGRVHRRKIK